MGRSYETYLKIVNDCNLDIQKIEVSETDDYDWDGGRFSNNISCRAPIHAHGSGGYIREEINAWANGCPMRLTIYFRTQHSQESYLLSMRFDQRIAKYGNSITHQYARPIGDDYYTDTEEEDLEFTVYQGYSGCGKFTIEHRREEGRGHGTLVITIKGDARAKHRGEDEEEHADRDIKNKDHKSAIDHLAKAMREDPNNAAHYSEQIFKVVEDIKNSFESANKVEDIKFNDFNELKGLINYARGEDKFNRDKYNNLEQEVNKMAKLMEQLLKTHEELIRGQGEIKAEQVRVKSEKDGRTEYKKRQKQIEELTRKQEREKDINELKKHTTAAADSLGKHITTEADRGIEHTTAEANRGMKHTTSESNATRKHTTSEADKVKKHTTAAADSLGKHITTEADRGIEHTTAEANRGMKHTTSESNATRKHTTSEADKVKKHTTAAADSLGKHITTEADRGIEHTTAEANRGMKHTTKILQEANCCNVTVDLGRKLNLKASKEFEALREQIVSKTFNQNTIIHELAEVLGKFNKAQELHPSSKTIQHNKTQCIEFINSAKNIASEPNGANNINNSSELINVFQALLKSIGEAVVGEAVIHLPDAYINVLDQAGILPSDNASYDYDRPIEGLYDEARELIGQLHNQSGY